MKDENKEVNKTLAELYHEGSRHEFGDISLVIENKGGKLLGKFVFHHVETENNIVKTTLANKGLPSCFGNPPYLINTDMVSGIAWDTRYPTLGDIIPVIEKEIQEYNGMMHKTGEHLSLCANCPVFDRCYRIAELNLRRRQLGDKKVGARWSIE